MPRSVERRVETLCTHGSIGRAAELAKIGRAMQPTRTTRPKRGYTARGGPLIQRRVFSIFMLQNVAKFRITSARPIMYINVLQYDATHAALGVH